MKFNEIFQVEDYSNKVATVFKSHGYHKGDVIGILLENRVEFIALWLGLSKLGIIVPLLNTNLRKTALQHSINVSKCQALIYGADFTDRKCNKNYYYYWNFIYSLFIRN